MNKHAVHHRKDTVILLVVLSLAIFVVSQLSFDKQLQGIMVVLTCLFYVGWGIIHHAVHHDLSARIVVEYILIGSLGMSITLFLLRGGLF